MLGFIIGISIGTAFGYVLCGLLSANGKDDK